MRFRVLLSQPSPLHDPFPLYEHYAMDVSDSEEQSAISPDGDRLKQNFIEGLHALLVQSTANDTVQLKAVRFPPFYCPQGTKDL